MAHTTARADELTAARRVPRGTGDWNDGLTRVGVGGMSLDTSRGYHSARYAISVLNPNGVSRGVARIALDGTVVQPSDAGIALSDDGADHRVEVVLG